MRIEQYQQGGTIQSMYTPVVRDTFLEDLQKFSKKGSGQGKEDALLDKAIIDVIKENGLPSDVNSFLTQVESFLSSSSNTYDLASGSNTLDSSLSKLIAVQKMANVVKSNKAAYDKAVTQVESNETGSDIALNSVGHLYVINDGKLDTVTINTFKENPEGYQPLTNNQLLALRHNSVSLAGRDDIIKNISNAVGMKDVMTTVEETIRNFGESKRKGYAIKTSAQVQKGLEGLYKVESETSKANVSKEAQIAAIRYIKNTRLNQNAKNVLEATAALNGTTAEDIIYNAIYFHTDDVYNEDLDNAGGGSGTGKGVDGAKLDSTVSFGESVLLDYGLPKDFDMIIGGSLKFSTPGYKYDRIENSKEGPLPSVQTLSEAYANLQDQGIVATGKTTYFGNIPLSNISAYGRDVLIDNNSGGTVAYLPVDARGNLSFSLMQQMQAVQKSIEDQHITNPKKQKEIWENNGFRYDESKKTGVPYGYTLSPFWIQDAYTSENTTAFNDHWLPGKGSVLNGNDFAEKIDDSILDQMLANYNTTHKDKKPLDISAGMTEDAYRGYVFIPLNQDQKQAMMAAGHAYAPKSDVRGVHAQQQAVVHGGAYNNGNFSRTNNGTSASDLN